MGVGCGGGMWGGGGAREWNINRKMSKKNEQQNLVSKEDRGIKHQH